MERVDAPDIRTYYANSVDILFSVYDFALTLGQMRSRSLDSVLVEQQARLIMSPQHMKVLAKLLADKVATYEATFGTIPVQPSDQASPE
jgi:hypothetical protein